MAEFAVSNAVVTRRLRLWLPRRCEVALVANDGNGCVLEKPYHNRPRLATVSPRGLRRFFILPTLVPTPIARPAAAAPATCQSC